MKALPRSDVDKLSKLYGPRCDADGGPLKSFLPSIEEMTTAIEFNVVPKLKRKFGKQRISLMDCGKQFWESKDSSSHETSDDLMPDGLHPNAEGHTIIA
mmetsp:Transcript_31852/g.48136  ORF Transcript_31852/g.48136 Transcript_31852/m.48136 type:complete len:99 (+) Transcript_31852:2391-2687(+)